MLEIVADDLGAVAAIDEAAFELAKRGRINGAAVFVTFGAVEHLRELVSLGVSLGIHLNMSTGRPLASPGEVPSLVGAGQVQFLDPRGVRGESPAEKVANYRESVAGRVQESELRREFELQVERFRRQIGVSPEFSSVHQDLDTVDVVRSVADSVTGLPCRATRILSGDLGRYQYRLHHAGSTVSEVRQYLEAEVMAAIALPERVRAQLICHPATRLDGLEAMTLYRTQRVVEFEALLELAVPLPARDSV